MKRTETIHLVHQIGGSYAAVRRPTDQTIGTGSTTVVDFTSGATIEKDTDGMFDTTDSTKLTVVRGGVYVVMGYVRWASDETGARTVNLLVDSAIVASSRISVAGGLTYQTFCATVELAGGAVITMSVFQGSGDDLDIVAADSAPRLTAVRVI